MQTGSACELKLLTLSMHFSSVNIFYQVLKYEKQSLGRIIQRSFKLSGQNAQNSKCKTRFFLKLGLLQVKKEEDKTFLFFQQSFNDAICFAKIGLEIVPQIGSFCFFY